MLDFVDPWIAGNIWILIILLVAGFALLVYGADWLVDGASSVAKRVGVSDLIIGLTVVAFGTSMPEFVVNMISSGEGNSELAITNVLGSNAINIFVVLGLTALIWPVSSQLQSRRVDLPVACVGALLTFLFACYDDTDGFSIECDPNSYITSQEGVWLVVGFMLYMMYLTHQAREVKKSNTCSEQPESSGADEAPMPVWKALLLVAVGLVGLSVGGDLCVKTATQAAVNLGVSDAIIGLTVVALGTSLPELATSVIAACKKNSELALGNCVGSCIFNVFFVLAVSSCVHPLQGYDGLWLDALIAFAGPALTLLFITCNKEKKVSRLGGATLLIVYAVYLTYRLINC